LFGFSLINWTTLFLLINRLMQIFCLHFKRKNCCYRSPTSFAL
jgi:hypothetical protein